MLRLSFLVFLLVSGPSWAQDVPVRVVSLCCFFEPVSPDGPDTNSIDRLIFDHSGVLAIESQYVNRTRAWSYIERGTNVCTIRSRRTADREAISYFTRLPHSIYPPYRLILPSQVDFDIPDGPIDLDSFLADLPIRLGVIDVKDYGPVVAQVRARRPEKFFVVPSQAVSYENLIRALEIGRVQGLIGDTPTVRAFLDYMGPSGETSLGQDDVQFLPIAGIKPNMGYMACSKTPDGRRIINILDQTLASPTIQNAIFKVQQEWFGPVESEFMRRIFRDVYGTAPAADDGEAP